MATRKKPATKKAPAKKAPVKKTARSVATSPAVGKRLATIAKTANAMLDSAGTADKRGFDLRLSAAVLAAEAKRLCIGAKLDFKIWCTNNIKQSWEEARKLAAVGAADDPRLALEDMRASTAKRMKASRARASAAKSSNGATAPAAATSRKTRAPSPYMAALDSVKALDEKKQLQIAGELAGGVDMAVVTRDVAKRAVDMVRDGIPLDTIKSAVGKLVAADRRKLIVWLTDKVEQDAVDAGIAVGPAEAGASGDWPEVPKHLKRASTKKNRS